MSQVLAAKKFTIDIVREALTDKWETTREVWQRVDIGAENSYQKILHALVEEGSAVRMRKPLQRYPGQFAWVFRRKQNAG